LDDKRTDLIIGDIFPLISQSSNRFDAILLDVDNGPSPITDSGNQRLYSPAGIQACRRALRKPGSLAIWSSEPSKVFEKLLMSCGFHVHRYKGKAHKHGNSKPLYIWVAAEDETILPPGGGERTYPARKSQGAVADKLDRPLVKIDWNPEVLLQERTRKRRK
jgi:hypothetical protein